MTWKLSTHAEKTKDGLAESNSQGRLENHLNFDKFHNPHRHNKRVWKPYWLEGFSRPNNAPNPTKMSMS